MLHTDCNLKGGAVKTFWDNPFKNDRQKKTSNHNLLPESKA